MPVGVPEIWRETLCKAYDYLTTKLSIHSKPMHNIKQKLKKDEATETSQLNHIKDFQLFPEWEENHQNISHRVSTEQKVHLCKFILGSKRDWGCSNLEAGGPAKRLLRGNAGLSEGQTMATVRCGNRKVYLRRRLWWLIWCWVMLEKVKDVDQVLGLSNCMGDDAIISREMEHRGETALEGWDQKIKGSVLES